CEAVAQSCELAADHLQYGPHTRLQGFDGHARPLQAEYRFRQAVVGDFKAAGTVGLHVGKTMDARTRASDRSFQSEPMLRRTSKIPQQFIGIPSDLLQISEFVILPLMPQNRLAKDQPEWHFVYQGFECARFRFPCARLRFR